MNLNMTTSLSAALLSATLVVGVLLQSVQAATLSLYTWRAQEVELWQTISQRNLISGVKIEPKVINYESYQSHVVLDLQNNKVDLFQWMPGASNLKPLIDKGFIQPYQGSLASMNKAATLASKGPNGQFYGVPFALQLQSVLTNKKLMQQKGIAHQPASLSELNSAFSQLKSAGVTPIHFAGVENWYLSQLIGEVMVAGLVEESFAAGLVTGERCFNSPEYQTVFEVLEDWQQRGFINSNASTEDYGGMGRSVALGNSAMAIDGGWRSNPASVFFEIDKDYQFGFWSVPGRSNKVYALGDGSYQANANSAEADAANRVIAFTATKAFAELFASIVKELPAYGGELYIDQPLLRQMANRVKDAYSVSLFTAYELNQGEPSYNSLVIEAYKGVFTGQFDPRQASQHIQNGLNSWGYIGANNCR